jgi:hypothetical protein
MHSTWVMCGHTINYTQYTNVFILFYFRFEIANIIWKTKQLIASLKSPRVYREFMHVRIVCSIWSIWMEMSLLLSKMEYIYIYIFQCMSHYRANVKEFVFFLTLDLVIVFVLYSTILSCFENWSDVNHPLHSNVKHMTAAWHNFYGTSLVNIFLMLFIILMYQSKTLIQVILFNSN